MNGLGHRVKIATGKDRWVSVPVMVFPLIALTICCGCYTGCLLLNGALIGAAVAPGRITDISATGVPIDEASLPTVTNTAEGIMLTPTSTPTRSSVVVWPTPRSSPTVSATSTRAPSPLVLPEEQALPDSTIPATTDEPSDQATATVGQTAPGETEQVPTSTLAPTQAATATGEPTVTIPSSPLVPTQGVSGPRVRIVSVDNVAEWVSLQNVGNEAQDLVGWVLVSSKGGETCPLEGTIQPGVTLRVWTLVQDADQGGHNCGFGVPIWDDDEPDAAILYNANGQRVDRYPASE
ncbi:MAG: hypothetical protein GX620_11580 [Chloroflexi bacterium]|nr:hypothetical protein [Chloroflexota bacterium]